MMKKRLTLRQKRAIVGLLFITPWLIGFIVYYVKSLILTGRFALSNVDIGKVGGYTMSFTGLDNFKEALFQHANFNEVLVYSIRNIVTDLPFIIFFSLLMAMLLNTKFKGRTLVRAIFFLPILLGSGAILTSLELASDSIQREAAASIAETTSAGVSIEYFIDIFMELGLPMKFVGIITDLVGRIYEIVRASSIQIIIFIAALQSISPSLYEVSKIEGATSYETFWKVTLPMVSPLILTNVVYTIVDAFMDSPVVEIAYQTAFRAYDYGLSSAMSILCTALISLILVLIGTAISKFIFYYN